MRFMYFKTLFTLILMAAAAWLAMAFLLPLFFAAPADKAMAVFLAEPISDFLAALVTTCTFFRFFRRLGRQ